MTNSGTTHADRRIIKKLSYGHISAATLHLVSQRRSFLWRVEREGRSIRSPAVKQQLGRLRHLITRSIKRDKSRHAAAVAARLQQLAEAGNSHAFWAGMKQLGARKARPPPQLRGADGAVLASSALQAEAFAAHFERLHQDDGNPADPAALAAAAAEPNMQPWTMPSMVDTLAAVEQLKHWRAADPAGVWAELLQAACSGSVAFRQRFYGLVLLALQHGVPAAVRQSDLLPFFKKGDPCDPSNYRGIQLVSMLRKVLALLVSKSLCQFLEPGLLEYQCGFRAQRGCADQLFTLRKLSELSVEWQQRLYIAFVDLRKAFDSIPRPALWVVLRSRGVPEQLISIIRDLHTDTACRVRVGGSRSRSFCMEYGVQQGCPLANPLFNVFFDHVVREALQACPGSGVTVQRRQHMGGNLAQPRASEPLVDLTIPVLMIADDLSIISPTSEGLRQFMGAFEAACQRWGLVISTSKTELMLVGGAAATACERCGSQGGEGSMLLCDGCHRGWHVSCLEQPLVELPEGAWHCPECALAPGQVVDAWQPDIRVNGQPVKWVDTFKYLGSHLQQTGGLDRELSYRIQLAAAAFNQLQRPFFQQRCIRMRTRMQVYQAMVVSVLLYGSEGWALTSAQLNRLEVLHRTCLRRMLRVRLSDRICVEELYARCNVDSMALLVARRQLRWLGHLGRMDESRIAKQMLYSTMARCGRRRRGRPLTGICDRYQAVVQEHLPVAKLRAAGLGVGCRNWHAACQDRALFRSLCP